MSVDQREAVRDCHQHITFLAAGQTFAADIMSIREIRGWTDATILPGVPDFVRGIINLRGVVLPVVDLKARLGLGLTEATPAHVIIVVSIGERMVGVLVDAVSDILAVSSEDIQPVPDVAADQANPYIHGIVVMDGQMVTLLRIDKLTSANVLTDMAA